MAFFIVLDHVKMFIQKSFQSFQIWTTDSTLFASVRLALGAGGEEGDEAAGQADAENVVDVGGGALQQWRVVSQGSLWSGV